MLNFYFCWEEKGLEIFDTSIHFASKLNESETAGASGRRDLLIDCFPKISFFVSLCFLANFTRNGSVPWHGAS